MSEGSPTLPPIESRSSVSSLTPKVEQTGPSIGSNQPKVEQKTPSGTPQGGTERPPAQQKPTTEEEQDMADLELGASLLAAMKRGKGQEAEAGQWEEVAKTARLRSGKQEQGIRIRVDNFDRLDGHKLTPEEQVANIRAKNPGIVPNFDRLDGHKLTAEEQVDFVRKNYSDNL